MKTLNLFGYVGDAFDGFTDSGVAAELDGYDGPLTVRINSPGGFAYDGIAIYNVLEPHKPHIEVVGLAASAASVIAMSGKSIKVATGAEIMIHDAWSIALGDAAEMRAEADRLDRLSQNLASLYAARTGGTAEQMRELMRAETYMSADEAIKHGFADAIDGEAEEAPEGTQELFAAMGCKTTLGKPEAAKATAEIHRRYLLWSLKNTKQLTQNSRRV